MSFERTEIQQRIEKLVSNGLGYQVDARPSSPDQREEDMLLLHERLASMDIASSSEIDRLEKFGIWANFRRVSYALREQFEKMGLKASQILFENPEHMTQVMQSAGVFGLEPVKSGIFDVHPTIKAVYDRELPLVRRAQTPTRRSDGTDSYLIFHDVFTRNQKGFVDRSWGEPRRVYPDQSGGEYIDVDGNFHHADGSVTDGMGNTHSPIIKRIITSY